jgi:hypothetical protein
MNFRKIVVAATVCMLATAKSIPCCSFRAAMDERQKRRQQENGTANQNAIRWAPVCADAGHLSAPLVGAEGLVCVCFFLHTFLISAKRLVPACNDMVSSVPFSMEASGLETAVEKVQLGKENS